MINRLTARAPLAGFVSIAVAPRSCAVAALACASMTLAQGGPLPDLRADAVDDTALIGDPQSLLFDGSVVVTVSNVGVPVDRAVTVILFEDAVGEPGNTPGAYDDGLDLLLGTQVLGSVAAGASIDLDFPIQAQPLRFQGAPLFAWIDADESVRETNEGNNVASTADDCEGTGTLPTFQPVLAWNWNPPQDPAYRGDPAYVDWANVMVTPVVADVTGANGVPDGVPDVIFPSTNDTGGGTDFAGVLRVVDGQTGVEWYSITDPSLRVTAACSPAVGDIDGDGLPEIICSAFPSLAVRIFEHDGTFKLDSVATGVASGYNGIALANLDPPGVDPLPEIIVRARVFNRDGTTRWSGAIGAGAGLGGYGTSFAADSDLDGDVEVVAGDTVYGPTGAVELSLGGGDVFSAVANFDADDAAEYVLVGNGAVVLRDGDGTLLWQTAIPGGGFGGPPTIADFDNDGEAEVGVAGSIRYVVIDGTGPNAGNILWQRAISDTSSNRTGSSVFDFEGDGAADVVYRDQTVLYLFDGATGADKATPIPVSSCTWTEYVHVADVDADGHAEIVAVANNNCGFGPQRGVYVFENINDDWVNTRRVWNQHAYSITNVLDDLTVPEVAAINWLFPVGAPFNNFRQNLPSSGADPLALPDLTVSFVRSAACGADGLVAVTVRVGNAGKSVANVAGFVGVFAAGGAPGDGPLGVGALPIAIAPGGFADVDVDFGQAIPNITPLLVAVDSGTATLGEVLDHVAACATAPTGEGLPGSSVTECDECNNVLGSVVALAPCFADLNCDGVVDSLDLEILSEAWGRAGGRADLVPDGTVDATDLAVLLGAWGDC